MPLRRLLHAVLAALALAMPAYAAETTAAPTRTCTSCANANSAGLLRHCT